METKVIKKTRLNIGDKITVQAYKNDGTLYRQWNNFIIKNIQKNCLYLYGNNVIVKEKNGTIWKYNDNTIWVLFNDLFFNCIYFKNQNYEWYSNIASPYFYENKIIKFIDYDIDIKVNSNFDINVRDISDYMINRKIYNYSEKLCKIIEYSKDHVVNLAKNKDFIFNKDFIKCYFLNNIFTYELKEISLDKLDILAKYIASLKETRMVIFLNGDMGSGKTAFTKLLAKHLKINKIISSPTFNISNEYTYIKNKTKMNLAHIDLYRLHLISELENDFNMIMDIIYNNNYSIIEWPTNKLISNFNKYILINFQILENDLRNLKITTNNIILNLENIY